MSNIFLTSQAFNLILFAVLTVLYALSISIVYNMLGGPLQDPNRLFFIMGLQIIFNIVTAYLWTVLIKSHYISNRHYVPFIWITLFYLLFIITIQAIKDPFFLSPLNTHERSAQLITPTPLGIPRLTAQFLDTNSMGLYVFYLLLILFISYARYKEKLSKSLIIIWVVVTLFISIVTFSKNLFLIALLSLIYIFWALREFSIALPILTFLIFIAVFKLNEILESFRFHNIFHSYRFLEWKLIINNFSLFEWFFGTGLSHWTIFNKKYLGIPLTDPHSLFFSIPGTFGLIGVLFYIYIIYKIGRLFLKSLKKRAITQSFILFVILNMIFTYNCFSDLNIFDNSPMSFLLWFILISVLEYVPDLVEVRSDSSLK